MEDCLYRAILACLEYLGLASAKPRLLVMGMGNSGKTEFLKRLTSDALKFKEGDPMWPEKTAVSFGGTDCELREFNDPVLYIDTVYEWNPTGIVYILDSTGNDQYLDTARQELRQLQKNGHFKNTPILVFGNRIDRCDSAPEILLRKKLELTQTTGKGKVFRNELNGVRPIEFLMCSFKENKGWGEGMRWMAQYV